MKRTWAVVGLSVLAGSGWLLSRAYPSELGFPYAGCVHFALIALAGLALAMRGGWDKRPLRPLMEIAIAGGWIFVLPGTVLEFTAGGISSFTSVALFCAIPLMTVFWAGALGREGNRGQLLWPALVGLFGALLLFPVEMPGTKRRVLCFAAVAGCCTLVGLASLWMHDLLRGLRVAQAVACAGLFGAVALGLYGTAIGWPNMGAAVIGGEVARCLAFDLPFVWLTMWLVREVNPVRLSARFLIAPLVTAAEGYAIERGPLNVQTIVALVLMAAGAAMLLLKDETEEVPGLKLR